MNQIIDEFVSCEQKNTWLDDVVMSDLTESEQAAAVQRSARAIQHILNPSEVVQLAAVSQNGNTLYHIVKNGITPSEAVQLAAVRNQGDSIRHIVRNGIIPSEVVQLAAVKARPDSIRYIDNPSESVQLASAEYFGWAVRYIKNPSYQVIKTALSEHNLLGNEIEYERVVKEIFASNHLLIKKWIRYGQTIRNQI